jgi:hypothetical protein
MKTNRGQAPDLVFFLKTFHKSIGYTAVDGNMTTNDELGIIGKEAAVVIFPTLYWKG